MSMVALKAQLLPCISPSLELWTLDHRHPGLRSKLLMWTSIVTYIVGDRQGKHAHWGRGSTVLEEIESRLTTWQGTNTNQDTHVLAQHAIGRLGRPLVPERRHRIRVKGFSHGVECRY